MKKKCRMFFVVIFLSIAGIHQEGLAADFSDWEKAGQVIKRFGEKNDLKTSREWVHWAQEKLFYDRYLKGNGTKEKVKVAETKSSMTAKFPLRDHWHGYESVSLSYTNLDFMEQAFGVHFEFPSEFSSNDLTVDQVLKRYGKSHLERVKRGEKTIYRYTLSQEDSLKNSHWKLLESQMGVNDELWVEFEVGRRKKIHSVEVLAIKAKPSRIPFTKNWKWNEDEYEED